MGRVEGVGMDGRFFLPEKESPSQKSKRKRRSLRSFFEVVFLTFYRVPGSVK